MVVDVVVGLVVVVVVLVVVDVVPMVVVVVGGDVIRRPHPVPVAGTIGSALVSYR